jgi:hypothetical protein
MTGWTWAALAAVLVLVVVSLPTIITPSVKIDCRSGELINPDCIKPIRNGEGLRRLT